MKQRAFVIHKNDNVATAIDRLIAGPVLLTGAADIKEVDCLQEVKFGFKIALKDIKAADAIIKNDMIIGHASANIKKGEVIHLHNITSAFDERSGTFDNDTGAPQEKDVYL